MQHPIVHDHLMLGWYLFGALVLLLLIVDYLIHRRRGKAVDVDVDRADAGREHGCDNRKLRCIVLIGAATALVAAGPAAAWWIKHRVIVVPEIVNELPPGQGDWAGPLSQNDDWEPVYYGADEYLRGYSRNDVRVLLYTAIYQQQSQGRELINDLNLISSGRNWQQLSAERTIVTDAGLALIETELVSPGNQRRLVWYCYRVAGHYTTSRLAAKALQLVGLVIGRERAAVIALAAVSDDDLTRVRHEMDDFLAAMGPAIAQFVDGQTVNQEQIR
jgi:EpsI family protein